MEINKPTAVLKEEIHLKLYTHSWADIEIKYTLFEADIQILNVHSVSESLSSSTTVWNFSLPVPKHKFAIVLHLFHVIFRCYYLLDAFVFHIHALFPQMLAFSFFDNILKTHSGMFYKKCTVTKNLLKTIK